MIYEKKYENGLRLVVKKMEGLMSVTMGVLVGTGASVETDAEDGISHCLSEIIPIPVAKVAKSMYMSIFMLCGNNQ